MTGFLSSLQRMGYAGLLCAVCLLSIAPGRLEARNDSNSTPPTPGAAQPGNTSGADDADARAGQPSGATEAGASDSNDEAERVVRNLDPLLIELSTHHPRVRGIALDAAAKRDAARYASWKYPDPRAGIVWSNLPYKNDLRIIRDRTPMTGIEFQVRQAIPFPGRLTARANVADVEARQALLQVALAKNRLARDFLEDVSAARELQALLELTRGYAKRFRLVSNVARTRYSVGRGTLADVSRAELNSSGFDQRAADYDGRLKSRLQMLAYYLIPLESNSPRAPGDAYSAVTENGRAARLVDRFDDDSLGDYRRQLLREIKKARVSIETVSLEVAVRDLEAQAARERRTLARMEYLPDFELFASYREREKIDGDPAFGEDFYSFGFSMTVPVWSALSAGHKVDAENKRNRSAQISRADVIERVRFRLAALEADLRSTQERIGLYTRSLIPQATRARDSARLAYQTGRIDFFALLESWNTLFMQETELIRLNGQRDRIVFAMADLLNVIVPTYNAPSPAGESQ